MGWLALGPIRVVACTDAGDEGSLSGHGGRGRGIALAVVAGATVLWPRDELPKAAASGQADPTRLVSATLTKVARVECDEADPGVPGSVCIKVTTRLAGGRQVAFDTTDPPGECSGPASGSAWP
jgi:hypothetical protein